MAQKFTKSLTTSIVKKQIMAISGLLLCGFLVSHLIGNMLIYVGSDVFNLYGHTLISNPLIYVAEAILLTIFLVHIGLAIALTIENKAARPVGYQMKASTGKGATFASSTMIYTGLITLVFLVLHLIFFKYGSNYPTNVDGVVMRDLYRLVIEEFSSMGVVIWYIFAVVCLGIHVSHGFWSAFQSLGINHAKYNCMIKCISKIFGVVIAIGYSALPIYCYLQKGVH